MAARQYLAPRNAFHVDGRRIVCDGDDVNKVSGTSMAGILGCSPWSTPFTTACNLLALAREDISGKDAVKVGIALEEKIVRYAGEKFSEYGEFYTAEEVFQKREGDHDAWESDFEDDTFAGHVDGIVSKDGQDYILEIKTSSNLESWVDGVPEYYYWQVALYNHFITKQDKAYVVLGIVNERTYRDYASWIPGENNVVCFELPIDQKAVAETVDRVREWYTEHIGNRTTPEMNPVSDKDTEMYDHLANISGSIDEVQGKIDELSLLGAQIDLYDAKISDLRSREQKLKDEVKDYMSCNNLTEVGSRSGAYVGKLSVRETERIAEEKLVAAGIDPKAYKTKSVTKSFRVSPSKKTIKE